MRATILLGVASLAVARTVAAQPILSPGFRFSEQTGEALYSNVCQACHMGSAEGALGAGQYPPLARNPKLEVPAHVIHRVVHGHKAMPAIGRLMTDEQVAAIVNYVRTHFGNDYKRPVTPEEVRNAR
jgi:mono/diheme cytochrome c family protein